MAGKIHKLIADGKPVYLRITSAISPGNTSAKTQLEMMDAVNLITKESCCIVADTMLKNTLRDCYPNDGYVHKDFQIKKFGSQGGKRYAEFEINEVRGADPYALTDNVITITAKDEAGAPVQSNFFQNYATYDDYRKSSLWRKIRRRVLKRDGNICLRCGGKAIMVHHRSYAEEVLAGNNDDDLASICEGCHNFISCDDAGRKRSAKETERLLLLRDESTNFPPPKVDLRLQSQPPKYPPEWGRMSAVQRSAWNGKYERLKFLHWLRVRKFPEGRLRRLLHNRHGMDDQAIDAELADLRKRKIKANRGT